MLGALGTVFALIASLVTVILRWGTKIDFDANPLKLDAAAQVKNAKLDALLAGVTACVWMVLAMKRDRPLEYVLTMAFSLLCGTSLGTWLSLILLAASDTVEPDERYAAMVEESWGSGDPAENIFARPML